MFDGADLFLIENIPIMTKETGLSIYDFRFRNFFDCKSITNAIEKPILLRIGAIGDFKEIASSMEAIGMELLFTEQEHYRVSLLENWYPLLAEYTPFSRVYERFPSLDELLQEFSFPVFIKGNRQTNHHRKSQSIIENAEMYKSLSSAWEIDKYLHWQKVVVRKYIPLKTVNDTSYPDLIPFSYEFRVFFWKQKLIGYGKYWHMGKDYSLAEHDKVQALGLAETAAKIIDVPFLTVDIAKTKQCEWIVIEVNDGQESGYAGVNRLSLWNNIIHIENGRSPEL